jgi:hypothetical protein
MRCRDVPGAYLDKQEGLLYNPANSLILLGRIGVMQQLLVSVSHAVADQELATVLAAVRILVSTVLSVSVVRPSKGFAKLISMNQIDDFQ